MIKKVLFLFTSVIAISVSLGAQSNADQLRKAQIIDSVQMLFYKGVAERNASLQLGRNGILTETDSTYGYSLSFDLTDVDFGNAMIVKVGDDSALGITLTCKMHARCFAYKAFGRRQKYLLQVNALIDDRGDERTLQIMLDLLMRLQVLLEQQYKKP